MDDATFDRLARTLSESAPRRRLLGGALGAVVAALASVGAAPAKPKRRARQDDDRRERGKAFGADGQKNRGGDADGRETSDGPADAAKARCVTLGKSCKKKKKGKAPKCCTGLTCSKPTFICGCLAGQKPCGATCIPQAECCPACTGTDTCVNGTCEPADSCAANCPDGCCENGECKGGRSDNACGAGGKTCTACPNDKSHCDNAGTCVECTEVSHCQNGQTCVGGECRCTAESCAGCCDGKRCVTATSAEFCGTAGEACTTCGFGQSCEAGTCACTKASCGDGNLCCDNVCTRDANCCVDADCSGGFVCSNNTCTCPNNRVECAGPVCCERDYVCHATSGECCLPEANPCGARVCGSVRSCGTEVTCGQHGGACPSRTCKVAKPCTADGTCEYDNAANATPCGDGSICCDGACVSGVCCTDMDCDGERRMCSGNACVCQVGLETCNGECCNTGQVCHVETKACCTPTRSSCPAEFCGSVSDGCGRTYTCSVECAAGQDCIDNTCTCTPEKCSDGCCAGDETCKTGNADGACGRNGDTCQTCSGDTPICDLGRCVGCRESSDCADPVGYVCSAAGTCVPCTADSECTGDQVCARGICGAASYRTVKTLPIGSAIQFRPGGLAYDADDNLYVSDYEIGRDPALDNHRVIRFDPDGRVSGVWGGRVGDGAEEFNIPKAIAVGPTGAVFVADKQNDRVQVLNPAGGFADAWSGTGESAFTQPESLAVDDQGSVYVVDSDAGNDRVKVFTSGGTFETQWGGNEIFDGARGIAVGLGNKIYVADRFNGRVQIFDAPGAEPQGWTGAAEGELVLGSPVGVAIDAEGYVYVSDDFDDDGRVMRFHPDDPTSILTWNAPGLQREQIAVSRKGRIALPIRQEIERNGATEIWDAIAFCTTESPSPVEIWLTIPLGEAEIDDANGIAVDADGFAYTVDTGTNRILKFDPDGILVTAWDSASAQVGSMNAPMGVALGNNAVYVTDTGNNRVLVFDATGDVIDSWGGARSGAGQFNSPQGITIGSGGKVYLADRGNGRVQRFSADGTHEATWTGSGEGGAFSAPNGVATDNQGNVYVVDAATAVVHKLTDGGAYVLHWGGPDTFSTPDWIAVGGGNVYVSEHGSGGEELARVNVFNTDGDYLASWGSFGRGRGKFQQPRGIGVLDTTVWVADGDRVKVFEPRS